MKFVKFKLLLTFGFFILFLVLLILIFLPNSRAVTQTTINLEDMNDREIFLSYPKKIWLGQSEKIIIQVLLPEEIIGQSPEKIQDYSTPIENNIEVDLVINGALIDPPGVLITPLLPDQNLQLTKTIKSQYPGIIKGTLWIHLRQLDPGDGSSIDRQLIYSKEIEIISRNLFGLRIQLLKWSGLFGFSICLLFLLRYSRITKGFNQFKSIVK